jgi:ubiquinone/menaquinone biosynthesis C-methylase UbiE
LWHDGRVSPRAAKDWDAHVEHAEQVARGAGFRALRDGIIDRAAIAPGRVVVDVGSGTGLLTLAAAPVAGRVWAIDSSAAMGEYLRAKAASAGLGQVETVRASATSLPLIDGIADVVISNYCFHELREADKRTALDEAFRVLKPGGRLVVGDMMFSIAAGSARDRRVVRQKVIAIGRRGLPGIWRLAKNAVRILLGRWEHPAGAEWWQAALADAGFAEIAVQTLAHEGGIACARRPAVAIDLPAGSRLPEHSQPRSSPQASRSAASSSG